MKESLNKSHITFRSTNVSQFIICMWEDISSTSIGSVDRVHSEYE